jgi:uncharacterized protein with ATP-grasp and redox domains
VNANIWMQFQPVTGADVGSFAHFTIKKRLPEIVKRIIEGAGGRGDSKEKLKTLLDNITHGKIGFFPATGPDIQLWMGYLNPHLGKTWLEAPFYFVEAYFYRMVLDAVNYFEDLRDPFKTQKMDDIADNLPKMIQLVAQFENNPDMDIRHNLETLLQLSLWGNKSDLSQLKLDRTVRHDDDLLIDDADKIAKLISGGISRVDIVLDNAGMELFTDLLLAEWLISQNLAGQVVLHAKAYPTFVSDATADDVDILIKLLEKNELLSTKAFINSFKHISQKDRIILLNHEFWNAPLHFYEMPEAIQKELSKSDLVIFKGDANYRRIFGDRVIPYDMQPESLSSYLPSKSASIRILKSEIITGIPKEKSSRLTNEMRNEWLVSGRFGIIQFLN